jgi:hypothetical protein
MASTREMTRDEMIDILLERDGNICKFPECGKTLDRETATIDHWVPRSRGGTWDLENLRLMHKRCNAVKGDRIPNPDGSLPRLKREEIAYRRAEKRGERPEVCETCMSGRLLFPGETCPDCDSGPQPAMAPSSLQVSPKHCDHSTHHCWMCFLGFVERKSAIITVLDGEFLDE